MGTRRSFSRLFLAAIVMSAIAACGGSAATPSSSPDAACTAYFDAVCTQLEACSPVFALLDGDHASCVARRSSDCKTAYLGPGSTESADDLAACFRALAPTTCESLETVLFENYALPPACDVLRGQGAAGSPCAGNDQCASAVCVEQAGYVEDDDPCGHCGAGQPQGNKCETLRDCARGLTCASGLCAPYASLGDPCDDAAPCHASLQCAGGTCAPLSAAGDACSGAVPTCGLDLVCNTRNKCAIPAVSGASSGTAGSACGAMSNGDVAACAHGFVCNSAANGTTTCLALAGAGDECADRPCALPLRCIHATCQAQDAATCH